MADDGDDGGDNGPKTAKQLRFELSNLVKQEMQHNRTIDEPTAHRTRAETIDSPPRDRRVEEEPARAAATATPPATWGSAATTSS